MPSPNQRPIVITGWPTGVAERIAQEKAARRVRLRTICYLMIFDWPPGVERRLEERLAQVMAGDVLTAEQEADLADLGWAIPGATAPKDVATYLGEIVRRPK